MRCGKIFGNLRQRGASCFFPSNAAVTVTVLADGDQSTWKPAEEVFYEPNEVLDICHTLEHVSDCGKVLFGEGTEDFKQWQAEKMTVLCAALYSDQWKYT